MTADGTAELAEFPHTAELCPERLEALGREPSTRFETNQWKNATPVGGDPQFFVGTFSFTGF